MVESGNTIPRIEAALHTVIATLQTSLVEVHEEIPCKTVSDRPKEMLAVKVEISAVRIAVALVIVAVLAIGEELVVAAVPAIAVAFQTEGVLALVIVPQVQIEEAVVRVGTV